MILIDASVALTGLVEQKERVPNGVLGIHSFPDSYCVRCPLELRPGTSTTTGTSTTNCVSYLERSLRDSKGGTPTPRSAAVVLAGELPVIDGFFHELRRYG